MGLAMRKAVSFGEGGGEFWGSSNILILDLGSDYVVLWNNLLTYSPCYLYIFMSACYTSIKKKEFQSVCIESILLGNKFSQTHWVNTTSTDNRRGLRSEGQPARLSPEWGTLQSFPGADCKQEASLSLISDRTWDLHFSLGLPLALNPFQNH